MRSGENIGSKGTAVVYSLEKNISFCGIKRQRLNNYIKRIDNNFGALNTAQICWSWKAGDLMVFLTKAVKLGSEWVKNKCYGSYIKIIWNKYYFLFLLNLYKYVMKPLSDVL